MSVKIPETWREVRLSDLGRIVTGRTPSTKIPEFWGGNLPFVTPFDISNHIFIGKSGRTLSDAGRSEVSVVPRNAVLVACIASIGKMAITPYQCATNQQINAIIPHNDRDATFILYALRGKINDLKLLAGTTAVPIINKSAFSNVTIHLPPFEERQRIAEVLSSLDEAIQTTEAVIEQTRAVKRGILEALITRGIGHTSFVATDYGEFPASWKVTRLEDVAEVRTGLAKGKTVASDAVSLPYLRVANVQDGYVDFSDMKSISIPSHQIERYRLKSGDVLMTEGGDHDKLGRGDVWRGQIDPCLHQNHVFAVRPDQSKILPDFLAAVTASQYGKRYFLNCAKRTTNLASINSTQVKGLPVALPSMREQEQIVVAVAALSHAENVNRKAAADLERTKAALMSDLLTGRKRVTADLPFAAD